MPSRNRILERIEKLKDRLTDFDAVVATSLENTYYLSGSYVSTIRLIPNRLAMLLVPRDGTDASFVVCNIEESLVRNHSPLTDIRPYVEFAESPVALLADAVRDRGLEDGTLGIETRHLPVHYIRQLEKLLPVARLESADDLFAEVRAVKDREEIEALEKGARVTEQAVYTAWDEAQPGDTERSVAERIMCEMITGGADILSFMCFAGGVRCSDAHPMPGDYQIAKGDLVRVDVGGLFNHYQSDVARTGVVGKPDAKQERLYGAIHRGQAEVIEAMRPGTTVRDLYHVCKKTVEREGVSFRSPHIGHCVGIDLHEDPIMHPFNETELAEDMVFYVEPFLLVPGRSAYHVEDLVRVTPEGGEVLTDPEGIRDSLYEL
jgi:Xaa-Pro aminopeptidase